MTWVGAAWTRVGARRWWCGGRSALLLVGVVALALGAPGQRPCTARARSLPRCREGGGQPPSGDGDRTGHRSLGTADAEDPALGLSVSVGTLGLNADGTVQVPDQHCAARLVQAGSGSRARSDPLSSSGTSTAISARACSSSCAPWRPATRWTSTWPTASPPSSRSTPVAMYSKPQFPAQRVYGSHGSSALQLVTCGGVFDHQTGSYLSNIVVYTSLTAVIPAAAPTPDRRYRQADGPPVAGADGPSHWRHPKALPPTRVVRPARPRRSGPRTVRPGESAGAPSTPTRPSTPSSGAPWPPR